MERLVELRAVLHQHVESLRERVAEYPVTIERRSRPDTDDTPSSENRLTQLDSDRTGPAPIEAKTES